MYEGVILSKTASKTEQRKEKAMLSVKNSVNFSMVANLGILLRETGNQRPETRLNFYG